MAEETGTIIAPLDLASAREVSQALALMDAELGAGLYGESDVRAAADDPRALVLVAREQDRVVAIAVGRLQAPADAGYYTAFGEPARALFARGRVGSLEALAVAPGARRRGLGADLIRRRVEWFRSQGCSGTVAVAWMPVDHPRGYSAPLFRELGFSEGPLVPDFYREESARDGWNCPSDGNPCRCGAILFWLHLPETDL